MNFIESFKDKVFVVADSDARVRQPENLFNYKLNNNGDFLLIPFGTRVKVQKVMVVDIGSHRDLVFAYATSEDENVYGWTSSRNFEGKFINETIGRFDPQPGSSRFGPNAAWSDGVYLGQVPLVRIVDVKFEIERLGLPVLEPYMSMSNAAKIDGVFLSLNSAFRSYDEQKYLYNGYIKRLPNFNTAAKPGFSRHQNGIAIDISVLGADGNETYDWLKRNGPKYGFIRTVNNEPWHWEYDIQKSEKVLARGTFKLDNVLV